jgi:hypothetical protein
MQTCLFPRLLWRTFSLDRNHLGRYHWYVLPSLMERSSGPRKTPFNLSESTHHQLQACTRWRQAQLGVGVVAILLVLFAISAQAQTTSITIGSFKYVGTVQNQSTYELHLHNKGVTNNHIPFSNVTLFVKGTQESTGPITTGPGCGLPPYQTPCDILFAGRVETSLGSCAHFDKSTQKWVLDCISIAVQFESSTKKNVTLTLSNGQTFCMYGINNLYLETKPNHSILDGQCNPDGFCRGITIPVIFKAAPTCK